MVDIILLIFLARYIGKLALKKGLKKWNWIGLTVMAWLSAEMIGIVLGAMLFGQTNLTAIIFFALFCALGGYLIIHALISKYPDIIEKDESDLL